MKCSVDMEFRLLSKRQWTSVYCGGIRTVLFGKWNRTFIHNCEMGSGKRRSGTTEQVVRKEASYCTSSTSRLENRITEISPAILQFTTSVDGTESCWTIISSKIERENTWDEFHPQWRGEWYKYMIVMYVIVTRNRKQSRKYIQTIGEVRNIRKSLSVTKCWYNKKKLTNSRQISIQFHIKWLIETDHRLL